MGGWVGVRDEHINFISRIPPNHVEDGEVPPGVVFDPWVDF